MDSAYTPIFEMVLTQDDLSSDSILLDTHAADSSQQKTHIKMSD